LGYWLSEVLTTTTYGRPKEGEALGQPLAVASESRRYVRRVRTQREGQDDRGVVAKNNRTQILFFRMKVRKKLNLQWKS